MDRGWGDVHPLLGGFDAWRQAGYPVERKEEALTSTANPALPPDVPPP